MTTKSKSSWRIVAQWSFSVVTLPFRALMAVSKAALATMCLLLFLATVTLPVATTLSSPLFSVAATVAEAIIATPNLLARQATKAESIEAQNKAALAIERSKRKVAEESAAIAKLEGKQALQRSKTADGKLAAMSKELAEKELILAKLADPQVTYRGKKRAVNEVVSEAAGNVAKLTTRSIKADIAGMAGQAVPYLGALAVVGVTAYDLEQSCELMIELHELDMAFNPDHAIDSTEVCGIRVPTVEEILAAAIAAPRKALVAIMAMPTKFDWEAGFEDLKKQVPEFRWNDGWEDFTGYFPDFYWKEGWDDLIGTATGDGQ